MEPDLKIKLYLDQRDQGITQPQGGYGTQNYSDYYFNVNLNRKIRIIDEYIDIQIDPLRTEMPRQLINPWFFEFGFFESITSTGISASTQNMPMVPVKQDIIKKSKIYNIDINK